MTVLVPRFLVDDLTYRFATKKTALQLFKTIKPMLTPTFTYMISDISYARLHDFMAY